MSAVSRARTCHSEGSGVLERVLGMTMRAACPYVLRDAIEPTNTRLVAPVECLIDRSIVRSAAHADEGR